VRVLAVGTVTFDLIGTTSSILYEGSLTTPLDSMTRAHGGRGANFATALAALQRDVRLVACVGGDFAESAYRHELESRGIDTDGLYWSAESVTPHVFIFGNNKDSRVYQYRDRRPELAADFCEWAADNARRWQHDVLYCTSEVPDANRAALRHSMGRHKVFAPGHDIVQYEPACLEECLELANVLLVNTVECGNLEQRIQRPIESLRRGYYALVVTQGGDGSLVYLPEEVVEVPLCRPRQVVDVTGSGDAFAAGFVHCMIDNDDPVSAARTGSVLSSFVVESPGCQSNVPTPADLSARAREYYAG
jgi:sugar/nucleoside kinase (ribokinase family)